MRTENAPTKAASSKETMLNTTINIFSTSFQMLASLQTESFVLSTWLQLHPETTAGGRCSQRGQEARGAGLWLGSWAGLWPLELTPCPRVAPGLRLSCGRPRVWWEVGADSVPSPRSWRGGVWRMGHCPLACRARGVAGGPAEGGHCVRKWPCRGH